MSKIIDFSKKRGKIYIATIDTFDEIDADLYLLCSTYSNNTPDGAILVDGLAPTFELYLKKKAWIEKNTISSQFEDFKKLYTEELETREEALKSLDRINEFISVGKNIVLFDDCGLGKYCHLNVLKLKLKEMGFRVEEANKYVYKNSANWGR